MLVERPIDDNASRDAVRFAVDNQNRGARENVIGVLRGRRHEQRAWLKVSCRWRRHSAYVLDDTWLAGWGAGWSSRALVGHRVDLVAGAQQDFAQPLESIGVLQRTTRV